MNQLLRIADRIINRPLMLHPDKVPLIMKALDGRLPLSMSDEDRARAAQLEQAADGSWRALVSARPRTRAEARQAERALPYIRTEAGTAIIQIIGSLVNRGAWVGSNSGMTSYDGIKYQLMQAASDPKVRNILLDIDSPGGEAVGTSEIAAVVRAAAAERPVTAIANGMMASAAYAIGSQATELVTTQTGLTGSVGVILVHEDHSKYLEERGVAVTLIYAGKHKADGNPFEPLPDSVRADLAAEVDQYYQLFVKTVAKGRALLSPQQIRDTEARTFIGKAAADVGLADYVGSFETVLSNLDRRGSRRTTSGKGRKKMSMTRSELMESLDAEQQVALAAAIENDTAEAAEVATEVGRIEGRAEATERFVAILSDERIKGRERAAIMLAAKSPGMEIEDVIEFVLENASPAASGVPSVGVRSASADALVGDPPKQNASELWAKVNARINAPIDKANKALLG